MAQTYNLGKVSLTPKGAYNSSAQYETLDILSYNGSSYLVLQNCVGVTPPNSTYYMLLASKGNTGATGNAGSISVGTVTTVARGGVTRVTNSGSNTNAVFDFQFAINDEIITNAQIDSLFS